MLRSLFAVIVAVIAGLGAAKFLEGGLEAVSGAQDGAGYSFILAASWFFGAFVAALIALLIGRRWGAGRRARRGHDFFFRVHHHAAGNACLVALAAGGGGDSDWRMARAAHRRR